ncbi:preprotein translocase, YajC subunit [Acididesulfobacillus acetoxydans]|uniref:Preprotein translocase, YajC subunit n=1 Tax=Acididesulfobacillus acetoxydans TaxID=1561005 RepID=A0A8S0WP49_9FIRM|nr:preprotein translocase subunit YajC [Acididesulfobacillus acetoxydans]CAA7601684.1 preprotein translocase, YajC subunit [Acididesulfobacillus acetoxydans]CEJ09097.1 yajC: preprotein translocase, YajC subunit [Acididesulfobacillus acetoxydans]
MPSQGTLTIILYFVVFFGIMYFLMIRPQQKQQKQRQAMLSSLRVKDKVITSGGIYGKITKIKEKSVMVQIADKIEVEVTRAGIASVENREITVEKDKDKKNGNKDGKEGKGKNAPESGKAETDDGAAEPTSGEG